MGVAVSGGGGDAVNVITGGARAAVTNSVISSSGAIAIEAKNSSTITAEIKASAVSVSAGLYSGAIAIGVATARNFIGYQIDGSEDALEVVGTITNSRVTATGALSLLADSTANITAQVKAGANAVAAGGLAVGAAGSGASADNKIRSLIQATIDGDKNNYGISSGSLSLNAQDSSLINAEVQSTAVAVAIGNTGVAVAIGVSLAKNRIDNHVVASISNVDAGIASGAISIKATESATIKASSAAAAVAIAGGTVGVAVSGGGGDAVNVITGGAQATVSNSVVNGSGAVEIAAKNSSSITAEIKASAVSVAAGVYSGAIAIGSATARNFIGYQIDGSEDALEVFATITNSRINAAGALSVVADSTATISAEVKAGANAVAAGGLAVGAAATGASSDNKIRVLIKA